MTNDPYSWQAKADGGRQDYLRLLNVIEHLADTAEHQIDAMKDTDLVRVQKICDVKAERDRMQQRLANEHNHHIHEMACASTYLTAAINYLSNGRKKKATEEIREALTVVHRNLPPF